MQTFALYVRLKLKIVMAHGKFALKIFPELTDTLMHALYTAHPSHTP